MDCSLRSSGRWIHNFSATTRKPGTEKLDEVSAIVRENVTERSINYVFFNYYEMLRLEELGRVGPVLR